VSKNYFDFLEGNQGALQGEDTSSKTIVTEYLPDLVTDENNSLAAFNAIQTLEKEKLKYIAENSTRKAFKYKSSYQISKAEVGRRIGAKPQPLFHSLTTSYSEFLLKQFEEANKRLLKRKDDKLLAQRNGLRSRTKEALVVDFREQEKQLQSQVEINIDSQYTRLKAELPYDVKAKLKIN